MIRKILKIISAKTFYILIGIFLSLSIFTVQAAWNTKVGSGQTLTGSLWNDMVDKLTDLDSRVLEIESGSVTVRNNSLTAYRWPSVSVACLADEVVAGGGGSCTGGAGFNFITVSVPVGNGWQINCDTPNHQNVTGNVYAMCLKR